MKIFGKELFKRKPKQAFGMYTMEQALERIKGSEYLPDFNRGNNRPTEMTEYLQPTIWAMNEDQVMEAAKKLKKVKKNKKHEETISITAKGVYEMKLLNEESFKINVDKDYIEKQLESFKERLSLIKLEEYDMTNGLLEVQSILVRLENRKKYGEFHKFYDDFPYTTTTRIQNILKGNSYLQMGQSAQFVPDLPHEAIGIMNSYTKTTKQLCDKKPVFYIIADKKDFQKTNKRRDPILLAQSPFGHFWQVLGAWDKEVLLLEEL